MDTPNSDSEATNELPGNLPEQVAAFQRIWLETFSKLMQIAVKLPPDSAPPDIIKEMRNGVFQGLAKSWDEFLRSPQFLEGMKQWMDSAIVMRKFSNEYLTRTHHEMQGTAREDIDSVMLAVRHMENRLLGRMEQIEAKIEKLALEKQASKRNGGTRAAAKAAPARQARAKSRKTIEATEE